MKSIQKMDDLIGDVDILMKLWDQAFKTEDWPKVNIMRTKVKEKLDDYYDRKPLKGKAW